MYAIRIARHGGPEALSVQEVPPPVPGADEVLIRTVASSLNPVDWKTRAWEVGPELPATLGWDLAGVVTASHHPGYRPGDRVIAMSAQIATGLGTWAEQVALPARLLATAPTTVPLADAAALPLAGVTALQALNRAAVTSGDHVLITGAAGAVGGIAVQLARHAGATVDALVSRPGHLQAARDLGADRAWHRTADLPRHTYTAVLDTAGTAAGPALAPGGRYVSIADHPLPDIPGAAMSYVQENRDHLAHLAALVDEGALRLRIAHRYPFHEVRGAHERFEAGGVLGKILLTF
ncbi:NADP-dependent oxidoreductase [Streptomyces sp. I05A-00742]|uniref:NADP-dependent oxidoreductase n=1 Tax=Streptomyces sp. I05A-00742 TaxID=2732853 RepID=UPI001489B818|nr:NADP-dependent oxidoreductase [Streptomyces sp. I05A-00742]